METSNPRLSEVSSIATLVLSTGFEPVRCFHQWFLRPPCIPKFQHDSIYKKQYLVVFTFTGDNLTENVINSRLSEASYCFSLIEILLKSNKLDN